MAVIFTKKTLITTSDCYTTRQETTYQQNRSDFKNFNKVSQKKDTNAY